MLALTAATTLWGESMQAPKPETHRQCIEPDHTHSDPMIIRAEEKEEKNQKTLLSRHFEKVEFLINFLS